MKQHSNRVYTTAGFSLIECMIYFFISTLLLTVVINWVVTTQSRVSSASKQCNQWMGHVTALDFICRDLRAAPSNQAEWKKINTTELIWHLDDNDIGWSMENAQLFRSEGTYVASSGQWNTRTKSLVDDAIGSVSFDVKRNPKFPEELQRITCTFDKISRTITLRNGVVS